MIHLRAGQVRRQQVGRELDPAEGQIERMSERPNGPRLRQARHPLDQDMPTSQQRNHHPNEQRTLTDDDRFQPIEQRGEVGKVARLVRSGRVLGGIIHRVDGLAIGGRRAPVGGRPREGGAIRSG